MADDIRTSGTRRTAAGGRVETPAARGPRVADRDRGPERTDCRRLRPVRRVRGHVVVHPEGCLRGEERGEVRSLLEADADLELLAADRGVPRRLVVVQVVAVVLGPELVGAVVRLHERGVRLV